MVVICSKLTAQVKQLVRSKTMMIGYRVVMGVNEFVAAASSVGGCEFRARTPPLRESKCGGGRRGALPVDIICGRHADIFRNSAINNMND